MSLNATFIQVWLEPNCTPPHSHTCSGGFSERGGEGWGTDFLKYGSLLKVLPSRRHSGESACVLGTITSHGGGRRGNRVSFLAGAQIHRRALGGGGGGRECVCVRVEVGQGDTDGRRFGWRGQAEGLDAGRGGLFGHCGSSEELRG